MRWIVKDRVDLEAFITQISKAKLSEPIQIDVKFYRAVRSEAQNNLMWLWCTDVSRAIGRHKNDVKMDMCCEAFGVYDGFLGVPKFCIDQMGGFNNFYEYGPVRAQFGNVADMDAFYKIDIKTPIKSTSRLKIDEMTGFLHIFEDVAENKLNVKLRKPDDYEFAMKGKK